MKCEFCQKERELIDVAAHLFSQHGVKRVSVEEICKRASISKMTFYKYFSNKSEIARTVLAVVFNELIKMFEKLDGEKIPFREKFSKMFTMEIDKIKEMGQPFLEEMSNPKSDLYGIYVEEMGHYIGWIGEYYRRAQEKGEIRKNISIESILFIISQFEELMNKPEMIQMFPKFEDRIMELGNIFMFGIVEQG